MPLTPCLPAGLQMHRQHLSPLPAAEGWSGPITTLVIFTLTFVLIKWYQRGKWPARARLGHTHSEHPSTSRAPKEKTHTGQALLENTWWSPPCASCSSRMTALCAAQPPAPNTHSPWKRSQSHGDTQGILGQGCSGPGQQSPEPTAPFDMRHVCETHHTSHLTPRCQV